jgi:hypothetical protein
MVSMMGFMKRLAFLFSCSAALACATDLARVHTVYLLKMAKGLDQYVASRLAEDHVFQVVTNPKFADTVLTDQIGEGFEMKMDELFPPPEATKPAPKPKPEEGDSMADLLTDTVNKLRNPAANSGFGRARGTIFLVDAKSRRVIWSVYEHPRDEWTSEALDRTAKDIVNRLKDDLKKGR